MLIARLLFVAITYGKGSLGLWKSLENSGNFFFYFVVTLCMHICAAMQLAGNIAV